MTEAQRSPLPVPRGWYALAFSAELSPGALVRRVLGGREIVLFRTASGALGAFDAHCPHLGAHFGHGGKVVGECVRCPFHSFEFDRAGACVATPYRRRLPKARASALDVCERQGIVLAWLDPQGAPPSFEVPTLDMGTYTPLQTRFFSLRGHPQETSENSVDTGHLSEVHRYFAVGTLRPARADGANLNARYTMTRRMGPGPFSVAFRTEFEVNLYGLGYSFVQVEGDYGFGLRQFVLSTPTTPGHVDLRIACAIRVPKVAPGLRGLDPGRLAGLVGNRAVMAAFAHDVAQDFEIWRHKRYVHPPALAEGDGPVGLYRRWAAQFYADSPGEAQGAKPAPTTP
jgi:phenylpropionate dioxygenase-like ring-hydroxylating dioxygenase large terminal subunit